LDTNSEHFQLNPDNGVAMPPWKGNKDDKDLIGMIPFLEGEW
jgi:import inner membrane translocase subunit TIM50